MLHQVIDVTQYQYFNTGTDFDRVYLSDILNSHDNIVIFCDFIDNTSNSRAAVWHSVNKIGKYNSTGSSGQRIGGAFADAYGANIYAGSKINIYTAVLDLGS